MTQSQITYLPVFPVYRVQRVDKLLVNLTLFQGYASLCNAKFCAKKGIPILKLESKNGLWPNFMYYLNVTQ